MRSEDIVSKLNLGRQPSTNALIGSYKIEEEKPQQPNKVVQYLKIKISEEDDDLPLERRSP